MIITLEEKERMVKLYFIVKVNEPSIVNVQKGLPLDCLVIMLQDLISPNTLKLNKTFYEIKRSGGIHNFLGFKGKIILTLVMKDRFISKLDEIRYAEIINTLKPDFYTTVDGETYEGEKEVAYGEIERCFAETKKLVKL